MKNHLIQKLYRDSENAFYAHLFIHKEASPSYFLCLDSSMIYDDNLYEVLNTDLHNVGLYDCFISLNSVLKIKDFKKVNEIRSFYLLFIVEQLKNNDL